MQPAVKLLIVLALFVFQSAIAQQRVISSLGRLEPENGDETMEKEMERVRQVSQERDEDKLNKFKRGEGVRRRGVADESGERKYERESMTKMKMTMKK